MKTKQNLRQRFFDFLIFSFLVLLPTQLGKHFFVDFSYIKGVRIDYLAPTLYLTDVLFFIILFLARKSVISYLGRNRKLVLLLFLLSIYNILSGQYIFLALYKFLRYLQICLLFVIFKELKIKPLFVYTSFMISVLYTFVLALLQFASKSSLQGLFYYLGERSFNITTPSIAKTSLSGVELLRPYATFSHPNSMAGFFLLIFIFFLTNPSNLKRNILILSSLFFTILIIFLSFSKIAFLALFFIMFFYIIRYGKKGCVLCKTSKILTVFILLLIVFAAQGDIFSLEKRALLIQQSLSIFAGNLISGVGFGHYLIWQKSYSHPFNSYFLQPVHNIFILFLTEAGIFLGGFIFYLIAKFAALNKNPVFILFAASIFITGSFDHYWLTLHQNMLALGVFAGIFSSKQLLLKQ